MKMRTSVAAEEALAMLRNAIAAKIGIKPEDVVSVEITTFGESRVEFTADGFLVAEEVRHRI